MSLAELGAKPPSVAAEEEFGPWFEQIADTLLNRVDLVVMGESYRIAEVEAYYHGPGHADPFSHRQPIQRENGRWYFHRSRFEYRGGTFKGLDLTLGDGAAYFAFLIRSIVANDGTLFNGPCVVVDHILKCTKSESVAALDRDIRDRGIWDAGSRLALRESTNPRSQPVYSSSRVGLSLKNTTGKPNATRFIGKSYRFLTEPRAITKGKAQLVAARHERGDSTESIAALTRCPKHTVERYVQEFKTGKLASNFDSYVGKDLSSAALCRLLGTWAGEYGG
ncbi:MAG TPA: hypothetical protein VLM40_16915 [Gemmata sp.]|nr:hypothetical protein [Gemmata sp.]